MEALGCDTLVQIQVDLKAPTNTNSFLGWWGWVVGITGSFCDRQRRNVEQDTGRSVIIMTGRSIDITTFSMLKHIVEFQHVSVSRIAVFHQVRLGGIVLPCSRFCNPGWRIVS